MKSQQQEQIGAALDAVDAGYAQLRAACSDSVGNAFRVQVAERLERQHRVNRGQMYRVFGELIEPPDGPDDPDLPKGTVISKLLWQRLRITSGDIKKHIAIAGRIRPRRTLTGPQLPPELPCLAGVLENGDIGEAHIDAVCEGVDALPSRLNHRKGTAERILVRHAKEDDANFVAKMARDIAAELNPDDEFDEQDRRRKSGFRMGRQRADGMSYIAGWADAELRGYIEAANAAVRPGRHHQPHDPVTEPDHEPENDHSPADAEQFQLINDPRPEVDTAPVDDAAADAADQTADEPSDVEHVAVELDTRSAAQRLHDALKLGLRAALASGVYGQHRGLPVTVIATTTLAELDQAAHAINNPAIPMPPPARTGGGSRLPMRDLLRMAANAIHYLVVFDDHTGRPLYLGRTKRIATADQRIICYARDRGCTRPGCTEPGYHCEVNHEPAWGRGGQTNADCLFFDCGPDHALITKGLLQTKITDAGRLAYTDGTGPPEINLAHHPEELLKELFDDDDP
jgi:Domain of unknown function (DUF222)